MENSVGRATASTKAIQSDKIIFFNNGKINVEATLRKCQAKTTDRILKEQFILPLDFRYPYKELNEFPEDLVSFMEENAEMYQEVYNARRAKFITQCYTKGKYNDELANFYSLTRYKIHEYAIYREELIKLSRTFDESFAELIIGKAKQAKALIMVENRELRKRMVEQHNRYTGQQISTDSLSSLAGTKDTLENEEEAKRKMGNNYKNVRFYTGLIRLNDNFFINTSEQNLNQEEEFNYPYMSKSIAERLFRELSSSYNSWIKNNIDAIDWYEKQQKENQLRKEIEQVFELTMSGATNAEITRKVGVSKATIKRRRATDFYKELEGGLEKNMFQVNNNKDNPKQEKSEPGGENTSQAA